MHAESSLEGQPDLRWEETFLLRKLNRFREAIAPLTGVLLAGTIVSLWLFSFILLTSIDWFYQFSAWSAVGIVAALVIRTILQTGLFIIGHDAIHGSLLPQFPKLNHWIGAGVTRLYALLSYDQLYQKHWQHHRHPGRVGDPDYHDGTHTHPVSWYLHFMNGYLDTCQKLVLLVWMPILFGIFWQGFHLSVVNLLLFWVLPILLSSIQLFYFGTYLTHHRPANGYTNRHHARSTDYSVFWSLLTCYHFGYHWEHHEFPQVAWYRLPSVRT